MELIQIQDLLDTGVPVGTTGLIQRQEIIRSGTYSDTRLIRYRSTRRYYRTYSETGVPVGTTELIQRQELIRNRTYSDTGLIRYRSTHRYYRTDTEVLSDLYSYY